MIKLITTEEYQSIIKETREIDPNDIDLTNDQILELMLYRFATAESYDELLHYARQWCGANIRYGKTKKPIKKEAK